MVWVQGTKAMIEKQQDQLDGEARGKSETLGDLDCFPGLKLCRGRKVVNGDLIQTCALSDEGADFVSQILRETRHRLLLARGRGPTLTEAIIVESGASGQFLCGIGCCEEEA